MSATPQDQAASKAANRTLKTLCPLRLSRFKKGGPYSSELPPGQMAINMELAEETDGRFVGPMPVEVFLEKYLTPTMKIEDQPVVPRNAFSRVATAGDEKQMYGQFMQAISPWIMGLKAVDTSASVSTNDFALKPDVSLFDEDYVPIKNRADFSAMKMFIEFKKGGEDAPFTDPPDKAAIKNGSFESQSAKAKEIRGQLTSYAIAHHAHQFRHFSFSVFVFGTQARFIRWDPSAVVVTEQFDYNEKPEIMAKFFWQFSHLPQALRGRDMSVVPAELEADVEERVRNNLNVKPETPLFRYTVPGLNGYCYGPRPPYPPRSIIGRTTRTLPVLFIPPRPTGEQQHVKQETPLKPEEAPACDPRWAIERAAYLKDCWRFTSSLHPMQPEDEIYAMLHDANTPNIPQVVCGGDVGGHGSKTNIHELAGAPWLCVKLKITPFVHYRLLLDVVGRPLTSFKCTKELVTGILGAMKAHWFAYNTVKVLHRDISLGNIILTDDGEGLLIDWELAKKVDENAARRRERTGTWQFMSAMLLRNPGMKHTLQDDIESFLHVLVWASIKYVPATNAYSAEERGSDLRRIFDAIDFVKDGAAIGGTIKSAAFAAGTYPPPNFKPKRPSPLLGLLEAFSSPFKSRYIAKPPTEEERARVERVGDWTDKEFRRLSDKVSQYDEDMTILKTSEWFIKTLEKALQTDGWPSDDKAEKGLGLDTQTGGLYTDAQRSRKSGQLLTSHSQCEDSKSMAGAGSLKRERSTSPTLEGPTKRPRVGMGIEL
ncbi:hypothetical protein PAXINDRAFT_13524 [Paxillus involutus ATCC 200175]|uniref:Fungal-type protein kinase domain-containing protein n=1 Tax=Paxillus involutus ATCC 200175 TaxID=664439 RepID=A0A0C9U2H3_PAXIN|nr:hypothetical protein PAXINDRAFT_13524 [Paxillus involutus ATCC 200175]